MRNCPSTLCYFTIEEPVFCVRVLFSNLFALVFFLFFFSMQYLGKGNIEKQRYLIHMSCFKKMQMRIWVYSLIGTVSVG